MAQAITVDFTNVTEGGVTRIPAGDYVFKVVKVEQKKSNKEGAFPYLNWKLLGVNREAKNTTMYEITTLKPEGLFNLFNFLVALGINVPKKKVQIPLDKCIGKYIGATVDDEEYQAKDGSQKKKSAIVSVFGVKKNAKGQWEKVGGADEIEPDEPDLSEDEMNELGDELEEENIQEEETVEEPVAEEKPKAKKTITAKVSKPKEKAKPKKEEPVVEDEPATDDDDLDLENELAALEAELNV